MFGIKTAIKEHIVKNKINKDSVTYAKELGVNIADDCSIVDWPNWGSEPYLITIGKHVRISYGCSFITHDGATWVFREQEKYKDVVRFGKITIGDNCFIGANSTIMPNVNIGDNCVIGACSLVNKDIPSNEVWAGNPAKFICKVDDYAEKCLLESPEYNQENLKNNRKEEILKIVEKNGNKRK